MNSKKAKALRAQARAYTVGKPSVEYNEYAPPVFNPIQNKLLVVTGWNKVMLGKPLKLNEACTRAVYKQLKKAS